MVEDAVLESGVMQNFLLRRLGESRRFHPAGGPSGQARQRRVALEPDYFGFRNASNQVWVGYGLAAPNGTGEITNSFLRERTMVPERVEKGEKRTHDRGSARRLRESVRET